MPRPNRPLPLIALGAAVVMAASAPAVADKVYRWTDLNGVNHYGDRRPDAPLMQATDDVDADMEPELEATRLRAQPDAIARLRIEHHNGRYLAWADNRLSGPIEVMLHFNDKRNIVGDPRLPARTTVDALGSALVAVLSTADRRRSGAFELRMDSLPGDPNAAPRDVVYRPPLRQPQLHIEQAYGGDFSHHDPQNHYAIDFAAPVGTAVLAARDGRVMQVETDFDRAGLSLEKYGGRANFIRIVHDDGSMGLYAHLKPEGVLVRVGQRVRSGQQIGLSGNTGYTTGPHLHFAVQVNRGMRLVSIPFRMHGLDGRLPDMQE